MKLKVFLALICFFPGVVSAADRSEARVGVPRASQAGARAPTVTKGLVAPDMPNISDQTEDVSIVSEEIPNEISENKEAGKINKPISCRDEYRTCMDEFCLLDETEGYRCACSANIYQSKSIIQEIQKIQSDAEKLYTEGVEREKLGAKVKLVFGESEKAKKASRASGLSFAEWMNSDTGEDGETLDNDSDIGDGLYNIASNYCASKLATCSGSAEMEETLYSRVIVQDCKNFNNYLTEQKSNAESNKKIAEAAVRKARLEMLDTTNKYNRGECLLAYKSCIADKGGCGSNFENCLDSELLGRRSNACENVLDQCMAVKDYVIQDWEAESKTVLDEAAKYADKNRRSTCFAKIQACLEDGCSTESNPACLTDVNVAAGVCPIIDECNEIIPGIKNSVNDKLGFLRAQFCQNDVDKCLQDKCGKNYNAPECLGKKTSQITALCPQTMFPSCKGEKQFNIIVQATLLQMDYQMLQGCTNYFGEQLGKTCGTDMSCLPDDSTVASMKKIPNTEAGLANLRETVIENSRTAVDEFFKKFEKDITVAACKDSKKPTGRSSLSDSVFNSAKIVAQIGAENRALRQLETKIAELSRAQTLEEAEKNCYATYEVESADKSTKNYSYIKSVAFEPSLRNCHVCRLQQVCEKGGESKSTSALKAAAGGLTAGASAGSMVSPGWGTAIGGVVGAVGGYFGGHASGGIEEFCQEIESCEDVNM
ncbi:MAG: hypothetical protein JW974_00185 [Alphaproteobacteria bacterium]|nr:hypothetical protein [Alphaproteobacteria bacterium]MBN2675066.1 hypothetical protein [Alphaproteobacteria bacterium]